MENLEKYTPTDLLKIINDTEKEHNRLKEETVNYTIELDELENTINVKIQLINNNIQKISELEKKYVDLIEELNNRENVI